MTQLQTRTLAHLKLAGETEADHWITQHHKFDDEHHLLTPGQREQYREYIADCLTETAAAAVKGVIGLEDKGMWSPFEWLRAQDLARRVA